MSLKARLTLLITALVAAAVIALSAMQIQSLVRTWLQHAAERSQTTAQLVKNYVLRRTADRMQALRQTPADLEQSKKFWRQAIVDDPDLTEILSRTLAQTGSVVEISIADERGDVIASSNPSRVGNPLAPKLNLRVLQDLGPMDRIAAIVGGKVDYESRVNLGVTGSSAPVFTIQVLSSSALLRAAILPEMQRTGLFSLLALAVALIVAYSLAQISLRPLTGLSQTIDQIASGTGPEAAHPQPSSAREFAAVEAKLRLLGEQFRGARQGATELRGNLAGVLARLEGATVLFDASGRALASGGAAEHLLGMERGQILARPLPDLFPVLAGAAERRESARETRQDGLILDLDPLPGGGALVRMRDAEGRQLVERQLGLSSRLAAISRLTGGVAHEIKNPLNSIALHLELLKARVLGEVPEASEQIQIIGQEISRLDRVVRTFLDFNRPVELRSQEFDVEGQLRSMVRLLEPEAEGAGVKVVFSGPGEPVLLRGDEGLLQQAFMNVLTNALEATPRGGSIRVKLKDTESRVLLAFGDDGPGIPADHREKIFQLYFSTKEKGSGIGLALTYRAVQLHGGSIEVVEAESGGAEFRIALPKAGAV